jgi:FMN phosphatase YigB (HAD superfamily)
MMDQNKTLLVDLDGTLVGSTEYRVRIEFLIRFFCWWSRHGKAWKSLSVLAAIQKALESEPSDLTNAKRVVQSIAPILDLPEASVDDLLNQCVREIFPPLQKHFFAIPGAQNFIHWAYSRYPLILATNPVWIPEVVEMRTQWAGLNMGLFRSFTHAHRMSACKPRKDYYLELLQQESLEPSNCLLIGNDFRKDGPASEVGIRVCILTNDPSIVSVRPLLWKGSFEAIKNALARGDLWN